MNDNKYLYECIAALADTLSYTAQSQVVRTYAAVLSTYAKDNLLGGVKSATTSVCEALKTYESTNGR